MPGQHGVMLRGEWLKSKAELKRLLDAAYSKTNDPDLESRKPSEDAELTEEAKLLQGSLRDALLKQVRLLDTSLIENGYTGSLVFAPRSNDIQIVGPDPYHNRKWYGILSYDDKKERWTVK